MDDDLVPSLLVGPLLRYVDAHTATVWVETDRPGTVEVLGCRADTFTVHGHHYALVVVDGLQADTEHPYTVRLDGDEVWPGSTHADLPASVIRTHPEDRGHDRWRIVFGSCRRIQDHDDDPHPDALRVYAERLVTSRPRRLPDLLLMLGDQVYACKVPPETQRFIDDRRGDQDDGPDTPPRDEVADFEEFTHLYRESWTSDRAVRWLLSTVPTAMIFDDHDIIDDWNISASWVADMRGLSWWHDRVVGGLMAYWLYQHLGNMSPAELATDATLAALQDADGDAGARFDELAAPWDRGTGGTPAARWSFARQMGNTKLLVVDSRNGRCLEPGNRDMLDAGEWAWLAEESAADVEHLLIASSVPILLARGNHHFEAWNEQLCDGAWGPQVARVAEALRRAIDLEHWAAFQRGFHHMCRLVADKADGRSGRVPASVLLLSGDVHCVYTAPVDTGPDQRSAVWQLTCSPMHYLVEPSIKAGFLASMSWAGLVLGRALKAMTPAPNPELEWRVADGPEFGSFLATLDLDGPDAAATFERADPAGFTTAIHHELT